MTKNPEYPIPNSNYHPRRGLKPLVLAAGGMLLLLLLGVAATMLPYLLHAVPVPAIVQQIQDERESPASTSTAAATERTPRPADGPETSSSEPVIPEDPNQPAAIVAKRPAYNAEYAELIADLDAFDQLKKTMSYADSYDRLGSFHDRLLDICTRFGQEWKKSGGEYLVPSYHAIAEHWATLQHRIDGELLENFVRHGQWKMAAEMRECEDWDEAVYYWRQEGGLTSVWHIGAGGLGRYLQEKQMPRALWRWLPYPDREPMAIGG